MHRSGCYLQAQSNHMMSRQKWGAAWVVGGRKDWRQEVATYQEASAHFVQKSVLPISFLQFSPKFLKTDIQNSHKFRISGWKFLDIKKIFHKLTFTEERVATTTHAYKRRLHAAWEAKWQRDESMWTRTPYGTVQLGEPPARLYYMWPDWILIRHLNAVSYILLDFSVNVTQRGMDSAARSEISSVTGISRLIFTRVSTSLTNFVSKWYYILAVGTIKTACFD